MHRYEGSRPWSVAVLASGAALGAVLLTGTMSSAVRARGGAEGFQLSAGATHDLKTAEARFVSAFSRRSTLAPSATDRWQIQVGSFRRRDSAEAHLRELMDKAPELSELTPNAEAFGALTRARFDGLRDEAAARRLCVRVVQQGSDCLAVRQRG